jgi:hypothetical protein
MKLILALLSALLSVTTVAQTYWQQRVDYRIEVRLNDVEHSLSASVAFDYQNNSPQALDKIYIHLWPNAYRNHKTALGKQLYNTGESILRFGKEEDKGNIDSLDFQVNGQKVQWQYDPQHIDIAIITLPHPLSPGQKLTVSTPFKVKIPSGKISRLGHIDQSYQITQWYPKPAVFDKNGWNPIPYLTQGEFYSEFGSFDVKITLPKNYVVGATGDLQTQSEIDFLSNKAIESEKKIPDFLVEKQGKGGKSTFPPSDKEWKTLHYTQDKIHDFAWFADKRYVVLKGEVELPHSKRKVTSWAMFVPHNTVYWQHAIEYINDGTYYYSLWNGDYPYNHVTAVDGTISAGGGMEYPTVTVIGNASSKEELEVVIVHEVGHNWFYGILGTNERVHGWMDEGLNTLNEVRYMQTKYPNNTRFSDMVLNGRFHLNDLDHKDMGDISYRTLAVLGADQPIETHSADFTPANYGVIMYQKTGLVFYYLMDYLGEELFDKCMSTYYEEWKFKHPQPEDLRATLERVSGKKLDWFFEDLIQTTNHIDYKIKSVKVDEKSNETVVTVKNVGQVQGPINITALKDTTVITSQWIDPTKKGTFRLKGTDFTNLHIDYARNIPEINRSNNSWKSKGLFKKANPVKLEFFSGDHELGKSNHFWTPMLGGNLYDKFMIGATFHNIGIPFKQFQYVATPLFSFGRTNLAGMAELSYTFLPKSNLRYSRFGLSAKSFGMEKDNKSHFVNLVPYWSAQIGNRGRAKASSHFLLIQGLWQTNYFDTPSSSLRSQHQGGMAQYDYKVQLPDHQFNWQVRGEMVRENMNNDNFARISSTAQYRLRYLKNKMTSWLEVRAYFGQNIAFQQNSPIPNEQFSLSMSGARGNQDLFMEDYNFGRFENSGFWSQQRLENMGGFRSNANIYSSKWLTAGNFYLQLPLKPGLFGVFGDVGAFSNGNNIETLYNAGIGLRMSNFLGVYFPLVRSNNMGDLFTNYGQNIRFTLKMNLVNKRINLSNLLN